MEGSKNSEVRGARNFKTGVRTDEDFKILKQRRNLHF